MAKVLGGMIVQGDKGWWSQAGGAKEETVLVEQWAGGAKAGGASSRVVLGEQGERKGATTRTALGSNLWVWCKDGLCVCNLCVYLILRL
jgi:hypothetical protein